MLTAKTLKQRVKYNPDTGEFTWVSGRYPGKTAGSIDCKEGYVRIKIDGRMYRASRLAFLYMTREWPKKMVDHINGIRNDNRHINLRDNCTHTDNMRNRRPNSNSRSGKTGVYWVKERKLWRAMICVDKKLRSLGYFNNIVDAVACRIRAEKQHGFHENHGKHILC